MDATQILLGLTFLCASPLIVFGYVHSWRFFLITMGLLTLLAGEEGIGITIHVGSAFGLPDILAFLLIPATLIRLARPGVRLSITGFARVALAVFVVMIAFSLARGVATFGRSAGDDLRPWLEMLGVLFYVLTWDWSPAHLERTRVAVTRIGLLLTALAVYHFTLRGFGSADQLVLDSAGNGITTRALYSAQALWVSQAFLLNLYRLTIARARATLFLAVWFGFWTIALQHRSVWAAATIGAIALLATNVHVGRARMLAFAGFVCIMFSAAAATGALGDLTTKVSNSLNSANSQQGTYADRTAGWSNLVGQLNEQGPAMMLIGEPLGTPYTREAQNGLIISYQPHNFYVQTYLRMGALGAFGLVLLVLATLARPRGGRREGLFGDLDWPVRAAMLVTLWVYLWAYTFPFFEGVMIGIALALARQQRQVPPEPTPATTADAQRHLLPA